MHTVCKFPTRDLYTTLEVHQNQEDSEATAVAPIPILPGTPSTLPASYEALRDIPQFDTLYAAIVDVLVWRNNYYQ